MRARPKPNQNRGTFTSAPSISVDPNQSQDEASSPSPEPINDPSGQSGNHFHDSSNSIQILDFHTPNPLVSYNDQIYTCSWTTTIGTDLILNPAQSNPADTESPILTKTRHKLSACPATLVPRREPQSSKSSASKVRPHDAIDVPPPDGSIQTRIPLETHASLARQRQAAFLENFIAIKAARGEKDEVTVYATKKNTGTGWRSQRKAKLEQEAESEKKNGTGTAEQVMDPVSTSAQETSARRPTGRPRGRSRGPSRALSRDPNYRGRKYKGTFFKGSEPYREANPQSDVAGESIPTPRRWEDLNPTSGTKESPVDGENGLWNGPSIANQEEGMVERIGVADERGSRGSERERHFNQEGEGSPPLDEDLGMGDEDISMQEDGLIVDDATEDVIMEEA